ncbi:MAG TPA: Rne/Rng family ribonuclease [Rhizomicrobium sp.]|nr:Rne/Rng family ribonuclease [Rhizomicrobium sp.]
MSSHLFINVSAGEIRVAKVLGGRLDTLLIEPLLGRDLRPLGDIILGRVSRVVPAMEAAFVEIGMGRAGFLPLRDAKLLAGNVCGTIGISDCVREGESVLVQVTRDPMGEKGAQLSAGVALPGHFLVMTPGRPGMAVSRRIEDEARREELIAIGERLRPIPDTGFIFRTAAREASLDDLAADAGELAQTWRDILDKREAARPPLVLHSDLGPIERALRDMVTGEVARIAIDDAAALERARAYCRKTMPGIEARLEAAARDLFAREGLEDEIATLSSSRVTLPCGGWITIEPTEALTAVDVNSGSFTQAGGRDETSLAVNLEAAVEIGRQLRVRDIGGLIVVDFIQLGDDAKIGRVVAALKENLASDGATTRVSPMGEFGIVAVTRRRRRSPFAQQQGIACAACGGTGRAPDAAVEAQEILRTIEREAAANPGAELLVTAAPAVADWLANHADEVGPALAKRGAGRVRFEKGEGFDVRRA